MARGRSRRTPTSLKASRSTSLLTVLPELDHAEERILADELNVDRKVVGSVRRTTVRVHRQLVTLRALIQRFEHEIEESENPALNLRTKKLLQRLDWVDTEIVELRDRSRLLQEEIMLKSS